MTAARSLRPVAPSTPSWTPSQQAALDSVRAFLAGEDDVFVLDGPAGTGKTTLLGQILAEVPGVRSVHLAAPTARAARVLREKTGRSASTLHSLLYRIEPLDDRPGFRCIPKPNEDTARPLVVVDEASMVAAVRPQGDGLFRAEKSLLDHLLAFVGGNDLHGQVLFVGDPRQLPPVGETVSAALCADTLRREHRKSVAEARLVEVVRQATGSPVLDAAGRLREALDTGASMPTLPLDRLYRGQNVAAFLDWTDGGRLPFEAVHLAAFNKLVQGFNADVRRALGRRDDLCAGDLVVLDADAWVQVPDGTGQVATARIERGMPFEVLDVGRERPRTAGLTFCTATLRACGEPGAPAFSHRVCLDHLHAPTDGLTGEQEKDLFAHAMATNEVFRDKKHPQNDPWMGALRLRFAYAMTVHKAQGSEWARVQVCNLVRDAIKGGPEHQRWLYTAVTRARDAVCWG